MSKRAAPAVGDFEGRTLIGTFDPDPATCDHHRTHWGLIVDASYGYGSFRDAEGRLFGIIRRIATAGETSGLVLLTNEGDSPDLRIAKEVAATSFVGRARQELDETRVRFVGGKAYPHGSRAFEIALSRDELRWGEGDHVAIEGRAIGEGVQWFTPWPTGGLLYTSRLWHARGRLLGNDVEGFLGFDQAYAPSGFAWGYDRVSQRLELAWYTWGNRYEDGTVEMGHVAFGHGHWGFALVNDERGELCHTTNVACEVRERDSSEWPLHIHFEIDGTEWEWIADPRGRMPEFGLSDERVNTQSDGQFRRVGESRKIEAWMAWGETAPKHGDRRRPAPPLS